MHLSTPARKQPLTILMAAWPGRRSSGTVFGAGRWDRNKRPGTKGSSARGRHVRYRSRVLASVGPRAVANARISADAGRPATIRPGYRCPMAGATITRSRKFGRGRISGSEAVAQLKLCRGEAEVVCRGGLSRKVYKRHAKVESCVALEVKVRSKDARVVFFWAGSG